MLDPILISFSIVVLTFAFYYALIRWIVKRAKAKAEQTEISVQIIHLEGGADISTL